MFITEVSKAYAVRNWFGFTALFQSGRTDKFIGGEANPITSANISNEFLSVNVLKYKTIRQ
jgi:hypothetical protein